MEESRVHINKGHRELFDMSHPEIDFPKPRHANFSKALPAA
jgi:hypothetical protein